MGSLGGAADGRPRGSLAEVLRSGYVSSEMATRRTSPAPASSAPARSAPARSAPARSAPARGAHGSSTAHSSEILMLPEGRDFNAVVVADTHSKPHPNTRKVIDTLSPDVIFHAGDIGDLSVLDGLRELAPLFAVRGNIDERTPGLLDTMDVELRAGERSVLKLLLIHIAVYGPKLRADVARLAQAHSARLVLCGHSHVPFMGRDKGITLFNPGSIGPRRFTLPITLGVLSVGASAISLRHVSCETGETWLP